LAQKGAQNDNLRHPGIQIRLGRQKAIYGLGADVSGYTKPWKQHGKDSDAGNKLCI
jgi:hypothetical protein